MFACIISTNSGARVDLKFELGKGIDMPAKKKSSSESKSGKAAKKPAAKKTVSKKTAAKKPAAKKAASKKPAAKKTASAKKTKKRAAPRKRKISAEEHYQMVQTAAYFRAQRDGFSGDARQYWIEAEKEVDAMLAK